MTDEEILKAFECCCGDDVNGTHCKDCPAEKYNFDWCSDEVLRQMVDYTKRLQAENAALRNRLEKAVELPSGNRVWFITEDEEGKESYIISKPTNCLTVDELYEIGKKYFTTREAAEMQLAELEGEKE